MDPTVLVPTMGALHGGHGELLAAARRLADEHDAVLAASIFVNPDQFNDPGDLAAYPRPLAGDLELMLAAGVEVVFVPSVDEVYPPDEPGAAPQPEVPAVGRLPGLEDRFRPGHFPGVCRVVSRLLDLFAPIAAVFGEKDWQQYRVVSAMALAQGRDTRIVPCPTAREPGGLAMSSRNTHLSDSARQRAAAVRRGIEAAQRESGPEAAERALRSEMTGAGIEIEYATVRDAQTLLTPEPGEDARPLRILAAGRLEGVRLLDNAPWSA